MALPDSSELYMLQKPSKKQQYGLQQEYVLAWSESLVDTHCAASTWCSLKLCQPRVQRHHIPSGYELDDVNHAFLCHIAHLF